jgi:hypothetical protein
VVLGFVVEVEAVGWLRFSLEGWCYSALGRWFVELLEDMLFVGLAKDTLFGELAKVAGDWLWRNDMTGSRLQLGLGCLNKFVVKTRCRMESIASGGVQCMVWFTSLGVDCSGGFLESCSIFLLDSRNMRQSLVRWNVSLSSNMQYRGQTVYWCRPRPWP